MSEHFAFTTRCHHAFASTGNARDALIVMLEYVVGVAMTWPFAVTRAHGHLHAPSAPRGAETLADLAFSLHVSPDEFGHASEIARRFGFPLDPQIDALLPQPTA